jgi:hypothetical protein
MRRTYSFRITASLVGIVLGQHVHAAGLSESCNSIVDCEECLSNGCVFAIGTCYEVCQEADHGATCYGNDNVAFAQVTQVSNLCELYQGDNSRCNDQTTCRDCVNTLKSDAQPCQWYAPVKACFGGGQGPFGAGATTCPEQPQPQEDCGAWTDCQACLEADCAWRPHETMSTTTSTSTSASTGVCMNSCDQPVDTDTNCYSSSLFPEFKASVVCQAVASTMIADRELCFGRRDCPSCTATATTDGSNCQWYKDANTGVEWCQLGGCNKQGICGSSTCPTSIRVPDRNVTSPDFVANLPVITDTTTNTAIATDTATTIAANAPLSTEQEEIVIFTSQTQNGILPAGIEQESGSVSSRPIDLTPCSALVLPVAITLVITWLQ